LRPPGGGCGLCKNILKKGYKIIEFIFKSSFELLIFLLDEHVYDLGLAADFYVIMLNHPVIFCTLSAMLQYIHCILDCILTLGFRVTNRVSA